MPGDAFSGEIDPLNTSPEYIEEMRQKTGYYDPVHVQYYDWVSKFVKGDFGKSTRYKIPVSDLIMEKIPNTVTSCRCLAYYYLYSCVSHGNVRGKETVYAW